MNILTFDIGGTAVKSAVYDETGKQQLRSAPMKTAVSADSNNILAQVLAHIQTLRRSRDIHGVAIASAGVIDPVCGEVVYAGPTIPGYTGTPLKAAVEQECGLPCSVENDVNAAALGESWLGAGKNSPSIFCITVGTGVGAAVILNGRLWHGDNFCAGEIGYCPTDTGASLQECASAVALLQDYQRRTGNTVDGKTLFARAEAGEQQANAAIDHFIDTLSRGLLPAVYLFAPQTLLIGGGIAEQRLLEDKIRRALSNNIQAPRFMPRHIRCATLGNQAGMLGALRHFLQSYPSLHHGASS